MNNEYSVAEEIIIEKQRADQRANQRRRHKSTDRLKAERAKDYIRFPAKRPAKAALPVDLRRVKKLEDIPDEE